MLIREGGWFCDGCLVYGFSCNTDMMLVYVMQVKLTAVLITVFEPCPSAFVMFNPLGATVDLNRQDAALNKTVDFVK